MNMGFVKSDSEHSFVLTYIHAIALGPHSLNLCVCMCASFVAEVDETFCCSGTNVLATLCYFHSLRCFVCSSYGFSCFSRVFHMQLSLFHFYHHYRHHLNHHHHYHYQTYAHSTICIHFNYILVSYTISSMYY